MLNDINIKKSRGTLRCIYRLKRITTIRDKNVATNKNYILRKMSLKSQNPIFIQNSILGRAKTAQ